MVEEAASLVALCVIKAESESNVKLVTFTREENAVREIPINKTEESLETIKSKINKVNIFLLFLSILDHSIYKFLYFRAKVFLLTYRG